MKLLVALLIIIFLLAILPSPRNPASGSGGLDPNGGMRESVLYQTELSDRNVSYPTYHGAVYENYTIPEPMVWDVGHWSK